MKKHLLSMLALVAVMFSTAQESHKVFSSKTIIWYGVDFTQAKVIGLPDESPTKIIGEYFKAWNDVTIDIDLAKVFQKDAAYKDPNGVLNQSKAREASTLRGTEDVDLTADQLAARVKEIPVGQKKDGLAVVFIVQSINKTADAAIVHVTFFDVATRKILWTKKMSGKPSGGNAKSAWAGAVKDILNQIEKKEFKAWKKEADY